MSLINGKAIATDSRKDVGDKIAQIKKDHPEFSPKLSIIQVGARPDSTTYVGMKVKAAAEAGVECDVVSLPEDITEYALINKVTALNDDSSVHGVLVQLPLPAHINERNVTGKVSPLKDVDGFGIDNIGELSSRSGEPLFIPCTPKGIMHMLKQSDIDVSGKIAVVLGRSDIVGSPVSALLRQANATVIQCHSHTPNIEQLVKLGDVVVAAIGKPEFVKGSWIKPGAVVIDVGTNFVDDSTKAKGYRMVGDVDFAAAKEVASKITPVPGGVGPMTVAMLLSNVFEAAKRQFDNLERPAKFSPLPLDLQKPVPSDIDVSRSQQPKDISVLCEEMGLQPNEIELFGNTKAKVSLDVLDRLKHRKQGKYILVAGITPTPLGEGKSTTTVGLAQALGAHLEKPTFACVRQPSMGPTFGIKGGAAGGGYSQVIPMDEFNLHLTGDIHAIGAAANLLAAAIDTRMFHEQTQKDGPLYKRLVPAQKDGSRKFLPFMLQRLQKLGINKTDPNELTEEEITKFARLDIDPETISSRRVVDCNDRVLRGVKVGLAPTEAKGTPRDTGFDITVASECMAILTLSNSLEDMRERLGKMVVASSKSGLPVTAEDLGVAGALTALMKDTVKPNVMQTLEGTPVMVHAGPFANISIGANSILADKVALKLAGETGYAITEAGFDFTMGGERFLNIKCRASGLSPDAVVIVATVRALKSHGGAPEVKPGMALPAEYTQENVEILRAGCSNLAKHIENARSYGLPVVVAINAMNSDTSREHDIIKEESLKAGARDAIVSNHWAEGGAGAVDLANGVIKACHEPNQEQFKFLYDLPNTGAEEKLNIIAREMYGASGVELSELARKKIDAYTAQGFGHLPICVAKTQYSLSADPKLKGRPEGFTIPIRDVRASVGAGYLYALAAEIMTIPGLPTAPGFFNIEVKNGQIEGMF